MVFTLTTYLISIYNLIVIFIIHYYIYFMGQRKLIGFVHVMCVFTHLQSREVTTLPCSHNDNNRKFKLDTNKLKIEKYLCVKLNSPAPDVSIPLRVESIFRRCNNVNRGEILTRDTRSFPRYGHKIFILFFIVVPEKRGSFCLIFGVLCMELIPSYHIIAGVWRFFFC